MIWLFVAQLALLFIRSIGTNPSHTWISILNGVSILLLLATVITLLDVMGVVRAITPEDD